VVVPNDLCYLCAALLSVPQCSSLFFFGARPSPSAVYFITCGQLPTKVGNKNGSKWKSLANQRVLAAACLQIICYIYVERQLGTESYNIPCQHREVLRDNKKLQRRKKYPQWYFICTDCSKLYTKYSSWNICNYNKIVYIFDCFYRSIFFYHIVIIPRISIYLFFLCIRNHWVNKPWNYENRNKKLRSGWKSRARRRRQKCLALERWFTIWLALPSFLSSFSMSCSLPSALWHTHFVGTRLWPGSTLTYKRFPRMSHQPFPFAFVVV